MFITIRPEIEKVKKFVREHKTLVACAATGIVVHKITYDATIKGALMGTTEVAYAWGRENGILRLQNAVFLDFINQNDLGDKVQEFIANMGE